MGVIAIDGCRSGLGSNGRRRAVSLRPSWPRLAPTIALAAAIAASTLPPARAAAQTSPASSPSSGAGAASAEARFFAGQKLYAEEKFHDALVELRASYDAAPSPNSLLYVARCNRELGQFAAAYDTYAKVIIEASAAKKYGDTKKAATDEQAAIAGKVGRIVVAMPPGADASSATRVRVGNRIIDPSLYDRELTVEAGRQTVRAETSGKRTFEWEGEIAPGQTQRVAVELVDDGAPPPAPVQQPDADQPAVMHPLRPWAFVSAGVGVIGMATFGVFGVLASQRYDDLDRKCGGRCPAASQDEIDAGRRETLVSNVGLVVGVAGLAGGVALFLLSPSSPAGPQPATGSALRLDLDLDASGERTAITLRGAF